MKEWLNPEMIEIEIKETENANLPNDGGDGPWVQMEDGRWMWPGASKAV